jgi:hypothetical protein
VIDEVARDGGYIADASAIMQNDTSVDNLRMMTQTFREFGQYSGPAYRPEIPDPHKNDPTRQGLQGLEGWPKNRIAPGTCLPWETKVKELPELSGDVDLMKRIWGGTDGLANMFIWQVLLSF